MYIRGIRPSWSGRLCLQKEQFRLRVPVSCWHAQRQYATEIIGMAQWLSDSSQAVSFLLGLVGVLSTESEGFVGGKCYVFFGVLKCYKHPFYCRYIAIIMQLQCKQCILRLRLECFDTRFRYNMFTCFDVGALASMSWVGSSWSKEEFQLLPSEYTHNHLDTWQYLAGSKSARDDEANSQVLCRSTQHLHHLRAFLEAVERHFAGDVASCLVGPKTWTS